MQGFNNRETKFRRSVQQEMLHDGKWKWNLFSWSSYIGLMQNIKMSQKIWIMYRSDGPT